MCSSELSEEMKTPVGRKQAERLFVLESEFSCMNVIIWSQPA
jgi:hypothetical protein